MASLLNIGVNGLQAQQAGLAVAGQNITNANTPGYSRQRVDLSTGLTGLQNAEFGGSGVQIDAISRITNEFAIRQVQSDTSLLAEMDTLVTQMQQLEGLLFDAGSGLSGSIQDFFSAIQDSTNAPESLPERQYVLEQGRALAARFQGLYNQLSDQMSSAKGQLETGAARVNELTEGIVNLNQRIQTLQQEKSSGALNGLLDQRDELIRQLSEQVAITTEIQPNGSMNVYLGKGQPLAVGTTQNQLQVGANGEILLGQVGSTISQDITNSVSGGELGALLSFRNQTLSTAFNHLGSIAYSLTQALNQTHQGGLDLRGEFGTNLFNDMNQSEYGASRVSAQQLSVPGESVRIGVSLGDPARMTISDYDISFSEGAEGAVLVRRVSDQKVVYQGLLNGDFPQKIQFDDLEISLDGGQINPGDRYRIQPFRHMAGQIALSIEDPRQLALGLPARAESALGNIGSGTIELGEFFDQNQTIFAIDGKLSPPLLVRFTSATTYDILDNSDPAHPKDLIPPRRDQLFIPGQSNSLLPENSDSRVVLSNGPQISDLNHGSEITVGVQPVTNGYSAEQLSIRQIDSNSGQAQDSHNLTIPAGQSADQTAAQLNLIPGVRATASTEVILTNLENNEIGTPFELVVNGQRFINPTSLAALSDSIGENEILRKAGIYAVSDGSQLVLRSTTGQDLNLNLSGDPTDAITLGNRRGFESRLNGAGPGEGARISAATALPDGFDFTVGGPYNLDLAVGPDATAITIPITGSYATRAELVSGLQTQIDNATGTSIVQIGIDGAGAIQMTTLAKGSTSTLSVNLSGPAQNVLGIGSSTATGSGHYRSLAVGGSLTVELAGEHQLSGGGALFSDTPPHLRNDLGFGLHLNGRPANGDRFEIEFNQGGSGDNRNGLLLAELSSTKIVGDPPLSLMESYAELIQKTGMDSARVQTDRTAAQTLLEQAVSRRESISGVNLDEEAANLIRFEQAYNASAQVISIARETFDVLINAVR